MIEKLDLEKRNSFGTLDWQEHWNEPSGAKLIEEKINELVNAVNKLDALLDLTNTAIQAVKNETPADPYAEQRKWIGKMCWFWDKYRKDAIFDVLGDVVEDSKYPYLNGDCYSGYEHCEPVKPDDDIIYKGE